MDAIPSFSSRAWPEGEPPVDSLSLSLSVSLSLPLLEIRWPVLFFLCTSSNLNRITLLLHLESPLLLLSVTLEEGVSHIHVPDESQFRSSARQVELRPSQNPGAYSLL
jgi:hypothetical protein